MSNRVPVLLTSPQDMLPEGLEYHNGNGTLCIIGEMDKDNYTLKEQFAQSVAVGDGLDYEKYAGNPVLTAKDLPEGARKQISVTPKSGKKRMDAIIA